MKTANTTAAIEPKTAPSITASLVEANLSKNTKLNTP